jgi:hypothetical protein
MRTACTELVGVRHPIVGFNRWPGVVAAGTKAGGFGVLAASAYPPGELDAQLHWIEKQVDGHVVGSFDVIRPAAEITRQMAAGCEQRITELGAML